MINIVKVREDLTGKVFGRLTVLEQAEDYVQPSNGAHFAQWLCECSCPEHNKIIVSSANLKKKNGTRSCGCLMKELASSLRKEYNDVKLNLEDEHGLYGIGYCHNTNREFYFDMDDYNKIKDYCWVEEIDHNGYSRLAAAMGKKVIKMNNFLGYKGYDHADRNPLNNRKYNLRPATFSENNMNQSIQSNNTSGFIGVSWNRFTNKWNSYININKKRTSLGSYIDKKDAIIARLKAEQKYYKEFAPQRHLFKQYGITEEDDNDGTTD